MANHARLLLVPGFGACASSGRARKGEPGPLRAQPLRAQRLRARPLPPRVTPKSPLPLAMHMHVHVHRYMFYAMAHVTEDFLVPALNPNPQP